MEVLSIEDFEKASPIFRGNFGHWMASTIMNISGISEINDYCEDIYHLSGSDFTDALLQKLKVKVSVGNAERLLALPEGAFITISNHPYGGLDGVMLIDIFGKIRPDFKVMVNRVLSFIKSLNPNFISVVPSNNKNVGTSSQSIVGIKQTIAHLREGHPLGLFPAGAVSDIHFKEHIISDREWMESIIRLIKSVRVPIVPVRFFDKNSLFFYSLGLINWKIRVCRLPKEVLNKKNTTQHIGIGNIITPQEQDNYQDIDSFRRFLRSSVYDMPISENWQD